MPAPEIRGYADLVPVGRGGFAVVYRARQVALNRAVAVKVLSSGTTDPAKVARFERECASIGTLSGHPHVVAVYDAGVTDDGSPYLAMEYLPQGSLADRLRLEGPLPADEAVRIVAQIADAIEVAHRAGVLHRDIKPENVLLDGASRAKIADFGIAANLDSGDTATGVILGTVTHTAPEVIEGRRASVASDVYSLGSLLATLLLGRAPFANTGDESAIPLMLRIVREPLPDLVAASVPPAVASVIEKAMNKDPTARYDSAALLAAALRGSVAGPTETGEILEPPTIPPQPPRPAYSAGAERRPVFSAGAERRPVFPAGAEPTVVQAPARPVEAPDAAPTAAIPARPAPTAATHRGRRVAGVLAALIVVLCGAFAVGYGLSRRQATTTSTLAAPTTTSAPASQPTTGVLPGPAASTVEAAVALVQSHFAQYTVTDTGGWSSGPAAALVGTGPDGLEQVFLFGNGHLLGRDLSQPSIQAVVVGVSGDTVEVRYSTYAAGDDTASATPTGHVLIGYRFDGSHFVASQRSFPPTDPAIAGHR